MTNERKTGIRVIHFRAGSGRIGTMADLRATRWTRRLWARVLSFLLMLGAGGCSWSARPASPELQQQVLPWLEDGDTTRDEVEAVFGKPGYECSRERITAYRLSLDGSGRLIPVPREGQFGWTGAQFNLVLAFDADRVLEEHVLIQLKEKSPWSPE